MRHQKVLGKVCEVKKIRALKARLDASAATRNEREAQAELQAAKQARQAHAQETQSYLKDSLDRSNGTGDSAFSIREISDGYHALQVMADVVALREVDCTQSHAEAYDLQRESQKHFVTAKHRLEQLEALMERQQKSAAAVSERNADDEIVELMVCRERANAGS